MADRSFLFMAADGYSEEAAAADNTRLGGLAIGGSGAITGSVIDMNDVGKIVNVNPATADNDVLVYGQSGANLAGLAIDTADLTLSGGVTITGLPATPTAASEATSKSYVDGLLTGLSWKDPASVLKIKDDSDQGGTDPTASETGEAWVVNNWSTQTDGDIVEWDGSAWQVIVANSGSEPPDGTRAVVIGSGAAGSFSGQDGDVAVYDATGSSWSFNTPEDGWALLITGESSVYENLGYTYDSAAWVQFTGAGQINAGEGLSKDGNTLNVNAGDGIEIASDRVTIDLASTPGLELSGTTPDAELSVLANTAAGIQITASGVEVNLESDGALVFDGVNGGLEVNLETTDPTLEIASNELGVKYSTTASGLDQDANGLKVKVDGSTILINGSGQIYAAGSDEATRVENDFTATEAVAAGDPVYWDTTADQFSKATAGIDAEAYVFGVARSAIGASSSGPIVSYGPCAGVLSGATPGAKYYLGASGGLVTSPPGANNRVILIGWAINATDLWVQPIDFGKKAA